MLDDDDRELRARQWWRFDRYEVVDGIVRPRANAEAKQYNPWTEYLAERKAKKSDHTPAYQDLINMAHRIWDPEDNSYADLSPGQRGEVEGWCRRHGLLGLWHHEVLLALFPGSPDEAGRMELRGYERGPRGWRPVRGDLIERRKTRRPSGPPRGDRLSDEYLANMPKHVWRDVLPKGGLLLRDLHHGSIDSVPLEVRWRLFFDPAGPLGRPLWPLPSPDSLEFWRAYGEPVAMMMFVANLLELALTERDSSREDILNSLSAPATPALMSAPEGPGWGVDSPSLVASMATMIITELVGGARPVVCHCGTPFLTKAHQSAYCSERCKNTAHTRLRRGKTKVARLKIGDLVQHGDRQWRVAALPSPDERARVSGVRQGTEPSLRLEAASGDEPLSIVVPQSRWGPLQVLKD